MGNWLKDYKLYSSERKVIEYIVTNIEDLESMSIKKICNSLDVGESLITKSCKKINFSGFKDFKEHLLNQYHYKKENKLKSEFKDNLFDDLKLTHNNIDFELIEKIGEQICDSRKKVIIFATGKTKIIARYFYFTLQEYGIDVSLVSSLYPESGFEVENVIIFVLSMSGNNSKVDRYLSIVNRFKKEIVVVAITSTNNFISKNYVDHHIFGNIRKYFSSDKKANPFIEKYVMMYLLDNILLNFFKKISTENKLFFDTTKSKNFI